MSETQLRKARKGVETVLAMKRKSDEKKVEKIMELLAVVFHKNPIEQRSEDWAQQRQLDDEPHMQRRQQQGCANVCCRKNCLDNTCCCVDCTYGTTCCVAQCGIGCYLFISIMSWVVAWYKPADDK